jgi:hypothetical protein
MGVCQPRIVSVGNGPGPLAVDSGFVYWSDSFNMPTGSIVRADKTQTSTPKTLAPNQVQPYAVAVDSNYVYWVTSVASGSVSRAPFDGGMPSIVLNGTENAPQFILANGSNLFWDNHGSNEIRRSAPDGTNAATIADGGTGDMVMGPLQMAIDASYIYWADRVTKAIRRAPLVGAGLTTLSTGTDPVGVAVNSTTVFWANYMTGTIQSALKSGGQASTVANCGRGPNNIAADENYVYWAALGNPGGVGVDAGGVPPDLNGSVRAAPVSGTSGGGIILAESTNPTYIAIDAACVYWSDNKTNNVSVVGKP